MNYSKYYDHAVLHECYHYSLYDWSCMCSKCGFVYWHVFLGSLVKKLIKTLHACLCMLNIFSCDCCSNKVWWMISVCNCFLLRWPQVVHITLEYGLCTQKYQRSIAHNDNSQSKYCVAQNFDGYWLFKYLTENVLTDGHCLSPYTFKCYIVFKEFDGLNFDGLAGKHQKR